MSHETAEDSGSSSWSTWRLAIMSFVALAARLSSRLWTQRSFSRSARLALTTGHMIFRPEGEACLPEQTWTGAAMLVSQPMNACPCVNLWL